MYFYLSVCPAVVNSSHGSPHAVRDHTHFALFPVLPDPMRKIK